MKILFLLGASGRIRNFDRTIMALAERGHSVTLAGRLRKGTFELPVDFKHERISSRVNPTERSDAWREVAELLRGARDYVRYFDPRYSKATRLIRRAYEISPTGFVLFCERHPWVKRRWRLLAKALAFCEDLIPTDAEFEAFLREDRPDLVLVTPLVTFESHQTDYVKAAHRLGLPVAFIPFSWDNLTNKGLMRIHPDWVLVWNEIQRREAIELHGCPPESVVVTGAARFDDFFAGKPSTTRAEFFGRYGLDPKWPLVLYLGSSQLTGPNEMELVRRWAESLRGSDDERLRSVGILIRPHPAVRASWAHVDYSDLGRIGVSLDASRGADQELFDSLYHSHAAVGLNTSAMLEAAIVGRPVHTLLIPGFNEGQVGTIHFGYLVESYGGLATVAGDFDEHRRQLAAVLRGEPTCSARSRSFAAQFLRPQGVDRPVAPILASEIERVATVIKGPRPATPAWHYPLRWALCAWLRRQVVPRRASEDESVVATSMSLRPVKMALEELEQGAAPVFVGPWVDSIANELLYWIPFVRWASATCGLPPGRLIVVSSGCVNDWYGPLAGRFLDSSSLFSPSELQHWTHRTVPQSEQNPKQAVMSPFDREIVERAARRLDLSDYQVLHPMLFFRVFLRLRKDRALDRLGDMLRPSVLEAQLRQRDERLPRSFVAVSVGFTGAMPKTVENEQLLSELLAQLAAEHEVVVVDDTPPPGVSLPASKHVHLLSALIGNGDFRRAQTCAVAQAEAFVGSHGDLAVLAAFCGTPALTYYSEKLPTDQLDRLHAASVSGGWARVSVERARRFKGVRLPVAVHA